VVGGGAGGLELATKLGRQFGRRRQAQVILVDRNTSHLWKPLLHEVATGAMDPGVDAISYRAHAKNHNFEFQLGSLSGLDRESKVIHLAAILDDKGLIVVPERQLSYDYLVLAIGSVSNDFNTEGVRENCIFLDSPDQAHRFRDAMNNHFLRLHNSLGEVPLNVAIVGGGATGVELSAELHNAIKELKNYGLEDLDSQRLNISLVEAGERILPALPSRISASAHYELQQLGVSVLTSTMVIKADADGLITKSGDRIPAHLMVWAAGIKGADFIANLGLETNRINQILVKPTLQSTIDDDIYVIGDLASCPQGEGFVPPRAQAAHQMASHCFANIKRQFEQKDLVDYVYKDHGSLVSLSRFSTVGSLMGNLTKGSMMVEGRMARVVYVSLYRMHQIALHGWVKTGLMMLVGRINRVLRPTLKLH
jgi:NADH dehydrogenase